MEELNLTIVRTLDRSPTLKHPLLNEHYHSTFGAIQESMHVFIGAGIDAQFHQTEIHILELGFGTGLNVWLTALYALENRIKIQIDSFEKFPLTKFVYDAYLVEMVKEGLCSEDSLNLFKHILDCAWDVNTKLNEYCSFTKYDRDIETMKAIEKYELIFFDAFNPDVQPELWTEAIFLQMHQALKPNGILVTYCAKGQVRRNMKSAGFSIEKIAGPPGKREMTRATKHAQNV